LVRGVDCARIVDLFVGTRGAPLRRVL
jgi:hypothetical protein